MFSGTRARANTISIPAPTGGWNARDALANMEPLDAVYMVNVWPTTSDVRLRDGYTQFATGLPAQVETLLVYNGTSSNKLFAISAGSVYDITSGGAVGAPVVTGLSNSRFQYVNMATAGGNFLVAVNGADTPLLYDGTTWSTTSITGVTQANLIHVNLFKNRIWFVEKDSLHVWYLPVNSISGAASQLNFESIASAGGYLMAMGTWTIDAGTGVDDLAVFVTSQGDTIVYQGTDPDSASTWAMRGLWRLGAPLGRRCFLKYEGDLLIIAVDGVGAMSQVLQSSRVNPRSEMTNKIFGAMSTAASQYGANYGWQLNFCPKDSRLLLNVPVATNQQLQYNMNTITGSWCSWSGIAANCWELHENDSYFGGDGYVGLYGDTQSDNGAAIVGDVLQAFSQFGNLGLTKQWKLVRPVIAANGSPQISASINIDYSVVSTPAPLTFSPIASAVWGTAVWGTSVWAGELTTQANWQGVSGIGKSAAIRFIISSDKFKVQWSSTTFVYEIGGFL